MRVELITPIAKLLRKKRISVRFFSFSFAYVKKKVVPLQPNKCCIMRNIISSILFFALIFSGCTGRQPQYRIGVSQCLDDAWREKMIRRGMNPDAFHFYLDTFKNGMPPHGGFAIGLERITACFLGIANVKECSMFPRDINRVAP